jgi:hypothetical protein
MPPFLMCNTAVGNTADEVSVEAHPLVEAHVEAEHVSDVFMEDAVFG